MALQLDSVSTVATAIVIFISAVILRYLRSWPLSNIHSRDKAGHGSVHKSDWFKELRLTRKLASALPDCTILPCDLIAFKKATSDFYWAQQESEVIPACVIRPRNVEEISVAVQILKREYDKLEIKSGDVGARRGLFAIRSGGHSPIPGAASMEQGVVIDLGHFCEVIPSQNEPTVTIGAGARWGDVSQALEDNRLAVVGGRNSAVGVGGFTLGGKLLSRILFSTRMHHGFCLTIVTRRRPIFPLASLWLCLFKCYQLRNRPSFWLRCPRIFIG